MRRATVVGLMVALLGWKSAYDATAPEPSERASAAVGDPRASAEFGGLDVSTSTPGIALMHANFAEVTTMQIETGVAADAAGDGTPKELVVTPKGVRTRSGSGESASEVITTGGVSFLRAGASYWESNGLSGREAGAVAGRWVRMSETPAEQSSAATVRDRFAAQFVGEWGLGVGEPTKVSYRGVPALKFDTPGGYVVGAGDPLLPVEVAFEKNKQMQTVRFVYDGVDPVGVPARPVGLADVLYRTAKQR